MKAALYALVPLVFLALPARAETVTVTVTEAECANFSAHTPDASVAYRPGVAADGSAVAPADLPGSGFTVTPPENIAIDIKIDPSRLPAGAGRYLGEATVGKVELKDGRVYYNGTEIDSGAGHAVAEACRKLRRKH